MNEHYRGTTVSSTTSNPAPGWDNCSNFDDGAVGCQSPHSGISNVLCLDLLRLQQKWHFFNPQVEAPDSSENLAPISEVTLRHISLARDLQQYNNYTTN